MGGFLVRGFFFAGVTTTAIGAANSVRDFLLETYVSSRVRSRVFADVLRRKTKIPITRTMSAAAPAPMYTINKEESFSFDVPPVAVSSSSEGDGLGDDEGEGDGDGEGEGDGAVQDTVQLLYADP